jgi:hypothetical protein
MVVFTSYHYITMVIKFVLVTSFHCIISSKYACCHLKTLLVKHGPNVKLWKLWINSESSHGDIYHLKNQNLYSFLKNSLCMKCSPLILLQIFNPIPTLQWKMFVHATRNMALFRLTRSQHIICWDPNTSLSIQQKTKHHFNILSWGWCACNILYVVMTTLFNPCNKKQSPISIAFH